MSSEEKYFNYNMLPGEKINKKYKGEGEPLISIITPYYNSKEYIQRTANSIINQTFPYWEWIIVNDGSTEEGTKKILDKIKGLDKRIRIINQENKGRIITRDIAIENAKTDLIFNLDSDDVIDETLLECAYWTLKTNPKASWAYCDLVNFDGQEFLWKKKYSCELEKRENVFPSCALMKKEAILAVGGYGIVDKDVHEDWHLWLRMLEKGMFPVRINMYGFWYRKKKEGGILDSINKNVERDRHAREEIQKQANKITQDVKAIQFPTNAVSSFNVYPKPWDWTRGPVLDKNGKIRLLFIFPWFKVGGADKFNYDLISNLDQNKFDITIITTEPSDYIWRQKFEKYAQVFDVTTFLYRKEWAGFIDYIIKTRCVDIVINSNSFFGYYAIPWLKARNPKVVFTDYLHSIDMSWRNGGYPSDSAAIESCLDRTYTCTNSLGKQMKKIYDRSLEKVKTIYIGVDSEEFDEEKIELDKVEILEKYKEKYKDKKVLLFLARISEEKRPIFMIDIMKNILKERKDLVLFVVGNGPELDGMKSHAKNTNIEENVIFFHMQKEVKPFYKIADVTVICSLVEGLTLTTYESLAMGTPVVTADVGGQKELVNNECGRVVQNIQTAEKDLYNRNYSQEEIDRYTKAILEVIDQKRSNKEFKKNCKNMILNKFTTEKMVQAFEKEFTELAQTGTKIDIKPENIAIYAQYLMLYNHIDQRFYEEDYIPDFSYEKIEALKEKLWSNFFYRNSLIILKKLGIIKLLERLKLKDKIKNSFKKRYLKKKNK